MPGLGTTSLPPTPAFPPPPAATSVPGFFLPALPDPSRAQRSLFCACGAATPHGAGECRRCRQRRFDSSRRFGGNREAVLHRDRGRCFICGRLPAHPHVHHRRAGLHRPRWLATLCPGCHARVHKLAALRIWAPAPLVELWAEQHPGRPLQLQLPFEAAV